MRNAQIILCKDIKLDKNYKNVLDYSETQMLTLCTSSDHLVARDYQYSFIRETGEIAVNFKYQQCLNANYIAYQNPDYSNKWFFAFINNVAYVSDSVTRISFTIDVWSTWFSYLSLQECFVIREHVNSDKIGEHTVPENLETGEYISTTIQPTNSPDYEMCFCLTASTNVFESYGTVNQKIPSGLYYIGLESTQGVLDLVKIYEQNGQVDAINSVFVIPKDFFIDWKTASNIDGKVSTSVQFSLEPRDIKLTKPTYVGNEYKPKNKKLLSYPYSFLQVSNHNGTIVNYLWEYFNLLLGGNEVKFTLRGVLCPSGSFSAFPIDYKNLLANYDDSIQLGKFPIGGFNTDTYTNWLVQNGANIMLDTLTANAGVFGGLLTGNLGSSISSVNSLANEVASVYQHSLVPNQARGNINTGDYSYYYNLTNLEFKNMSIKNEYAKIIDDYFTRFGYKVNSLKVPNITGRKNWNYIQIGSDEIIFYGAISNNYLDTLNNIARSGVTIWHDHNSIGNYNLDNSII